MRRNTMQPDLDRNRKRAGPYIPPPLNKRIHTKRLSLVEDDRLPSNSQHDMDMQHTSEHYIPTMDPPRSSVFALRRNTSILPSSAGQTSIDKLFTTYNSQDIITPPKRIALELRTYKSTEDQRKHLLGVSNYLTEVGFDEVPIVRNIRSLSGRSFQSMFKFLVERAFPGYVFKRKFEDEVMDIIQTWEYPLADTINPKDLLAIGALHSTPAFYALLYWLVQCCKAQDTLQSPPEEPLDTLEAFTSGRAFQSFSAENFKDAVNNQLDLEKSKRSLEATFANVANTTNEKIDRLKTRLKELQERYKEMEGSVPQLETIREKVEILLSDKEKYQKVVEEKSAKIEKYKSQNERVRREIDRIKEARLQIKMQDEAIKEHWKANNTSREEMEYIEREYNKATEELTEETAQMNDLERSINELESGCNKFKSQIESHIKDFNEKIGRLMPGAANMQIVYNPHGKTIKEMLNVDIDRDIITALNNIDRQAKNENVAMTEENMKKRDAISQLKAKIEMQKQKIKEENEKIVPLTLLYERKHAEAQEENKRYNAIRDQYENERMEMLRESQATVDRARKRVEQQEREYNQKLQDSAERKRELILALDDCTPALIEKLKNMKLSTQKFKSKVQEVSSTIDDS